MPNFRAWGIAGAYTARGMTEPPLLFEDDRQPSIGVAHVVPERGLDRYPDGLSYSVPPSLAGLRVGQRVVVPLGRGNRPAPGFVVEIKPGPDAAEAGGRALKTILRLDAAGAELAGPRIVASSRLQSGFEPPFCQEAWRSSPEPQEVSL